MTDEERATDIVARHLDVRSSATLNPSGDIQVRQAVGAVRLAIAETREADAREADEWAFQPGHDAQTARCVAAAIRARR